MVLRFKTKAKHYTLSRAAYPNALGKFSLEPYVQINCLRHDFGLKL